MTNPQSLEDCLEECVSEFEKTLRTNGTKLIEFKENIYVSEFWNKQFDSVLQTLFQQSFIDIQSINIHHAAIQFFNADKHRITTFRWDTDYISNWDLNRWEIMKEVLGKTQKRDSDDLPYSNLGNFLVKWSDLSASPIPVLKFAFSKNSPVHNINDKYLNIGNLEKFFPRLRNASADDLIQLASKSENDIPGVNEFFNDKFQNFFGSLKKEKIDSEKSNLMIINNLYAVQDFFKNNNTLYLYYIPTWHHSTSYLGLILSAPLEDDILMVFKRFIDRIIGLAWGCDSRRRLKQDLSRMVNDARNLSRAAIMSRNLSHNVGSHALANPRLLESIGVLDQATDPGESNKTKTADFIHPDGNFGPVRMGELWNARTRYLTLNAYLQGRLDFIARTMGSSKSFPEALWFVNDLVRGFLSQHVLLNTLLSDLGYTLKDLAFHIKKYHMKTANPSDIEAIDKIEIERVFQGFSPTNDDSRRHMNFEELPTKHPGDLLICIPGGMVGCHAFYGILENLLRNAVKYGAESRGQGQGTAGRLEIHLELREVDLPPLEGACSVTRCYSLVLWDSLSRKSTSKSPSKDEGIADKVRAGLFKELVSEESIENQKSGVEHGNAIGGHGVQEMLVCAKFLAHNLEWPSDKTIEQNETQFTEWKAYIDFLKTSGETNFDKPNHLLCYDEQILNNKIQLKYEMLFKQPVLLGIVWPIPENGESAGAYGPVPHFPMVHRLKSLKCLAGSQAAFGLVLIQKKDDIDAHLQEVAKDQRHTKLPYRLLFVFPDDLLCLMGHIQEMNGEFPEKQGICPQEIPPTRRVRSASIAEILDPKAREASILFGDNTNKEEWEKIILKVYDAWLRAFKGAELRRGGGKKWHLMVGFERGDPTLLFQQWGGVKGERGWNIDEFSSQVALHLTTKIQTKDEKGNPKDLIYRTLLNMKNLPANLPHSCKIYFDNHHNVFQDNILSRPPGFVGGYQTFSGSTQANLCQSLEKPPTNNFLRKYYILSLAEAMLTRVGILDERVAESVMMYSDSKPEGFKPELTLLQHQSVFPLFSLQQSEALHRLTSVPEKFKTLMGTQPTEEPLEGLKFTSTGVRIGGLVPPVGTEPGKIRDISRELDFLVIHQGVVDQAPKAWPSGDALEQLYQCVPSVVITSGRGTESLQFKDQPFLEFTELSDTVYRQPNKVALANNLLALRTPDDIKKS